jgi:hypothetical protein
MDICQARRAGGRNRVIEVGGEAARFPALPRTRVDELIGRGFVS